MKRLLTITLAALLCLSCLGLYGCGSPDDTPDTEKSTHPSPASTAASDVSTDTVSETETNAETKTTPDIRTLWGSVEEYTAQDPWKTYWL